VADDEEQTRGRGVNVAKSINAVLAVNVNEPHSKTSVSSRRRIVQRNGKTIVDEYEEGGSDEQR
jgi:hypothetical protein